MSDDLVKRFRDHNVNAPEFRFARAALEGKKSE